MPFGCSSPFAGETSVSCSIVTTVHTKVHITFPIPFTPATLPSLALGIGAGSRQSCVLAHRSFNCSFARPDYSRRTCSQGHVVPDVVLMEQGTESGDALFTAKVAVSTSKLLCNIDGLTTSMTRNDVYEFVSSPAKAGSRSQFASKP